eukprot:5490650-Ditylum_brightwellii.AAC.1
MPRVGQRVITLFANQLLQLKNCAGGSSVNHIPNVSVGSTRGKVLLDAQVDVGIDPDSPNNFNDSLIGIRKIHHEDVVDKSSVHGSGDPHPEHTFLLQKDIQVAALSWEQSLLCHHLLIDKI